MEMSHKGGLKESLEKIVADEDGGQIIEEMRNIILKDMVDENQIQMAMAEALGTKPPEQNGDRYPDGVEIKPTTLTRQEAIEMDGDELRQGLANGRYILSNV